MDAVNKTLSNGVQMPTLGFGTWKLTEEQADAAVCTALHADYRHIDTATAYKNEAAVGAAIKKSGVARQDIFLTTKLWNADQGYQSTLDALERSLSMLQTDYVDLYLIHWPHDRKFFDDWEEKNAQTWRAFERLYEDGKIRAIGTSNFRPRHLENLVQNGSVAHMLNQIEFHPGMLQTETRAYCQAHEIAVSGWSPLGSGRLFTSELLQEIARNYRKSAAQLCLRWALQQDVIPVPKSTNDARIRENLDIYDFKIAQEDMERIGQIDCGWSGLDPDNLLY